MNPLGPLPASNSPQYSVDLVDGHKILREALMMGAALVITYAPELAGVTYTVHGQDVTPIVVLAVRLLAEAARRFLTGPAPAAAPPPAAAP